MKYLFVSYRDWALKIFDNIKDERWSHISTTEELSQIHPSTYNLIFFVGWSEIISDRIIRENNSICLHPSDLPYYRGGSPIQHQIQSGESKSKISFFIMNDKLDAGDIVSQVQFSLEGNLSNVFDSIIDSASKEIPKIVERFESKNLTQIQQASYPYRPHKRRKPEHSEIKVSDLLYLSAKEIHDKIRSLQDPYPNAYIKLRDGSKLYLDNSHYEMPEPGQEKRILVLGHKGMLGHMVYKYLSQFHEVVTIPHRFPSEEFKRSIIKFDGHYIINCIGSIPQKNTDFTINSELPKWLERASRCRVIHPATDCEMDEDNYGLSKRKATEYIMSYGKKTKVIRASIIGPEISSYKSLFEWFMRNDSQRISGYTDAIWNGITTLEWAKICNNMIQSWDSYKRVNTVEGERISKFHLLIMLSEEFDKEIIITPAQGRGKDKTLIGEIKAPSIRKQITELINFYYR